VGEATKEFKPTVFVVDENIICTDPPVILKKKKKYWLKSLADNRYADKMVLIWTEDGIELRICWEVRKDEKSRYVRDVEG